MERRDFCKASLIGGAAIMADPLKLFSAQKPMQLLGSRFVTFCIMIRTSPWEVSRDVKLINRDEGFAHTLEVVKHLRETFAKNVPGGRLTWGFTLNALEDKRQNYADIRRYVAECRHQYGDEISYFPGYFPAMYLPRERINREMTEALQRITAIAGGGYRPKAVMGGFLSANNLAYLAEKENIHVAHAVIWSQHETDGGGADGSPSYPFYPSKQHFCKPAQGSSDFIDCVNLDGWSVDFLNALQSGNVWGTTPFNGAASRRGVGPIETYGDWGLEIGHAAVMHTQSIHFDRGFELNGFGWIPNIWEAALVKIAERKNWDDTLAYRALDKWTSATLQRWPDVKFVTFGEYGEAWRAQYKDNSQWNYRFEEKGLGIGNSWGDKEIKWYMNREFRLATVRNWHKNTPEMVVDFTRYDLPASEPADPSPEHPVKDWSLMNVMNQKGLRPQDKSVLLGQLSADDKSLIAKHYPELLK